MASVTIFKEIISIDRDSLPDKGKQLYDEISGFIFSGVWTKSEKTKSMLPIINDSADEIACKMGISKTNVLASRSQASDKLRKILGKNLHAKLLSADSKIFEDLRRKMQVAVAEVTEVSEIFPTGILDFVPAEESSREFDLQDCGREVDFLASFSMESIRRRLQSLDEEKLKYLLGVLDKPNHYKVEVGSRVKNDAKFEIIGQILYNSKFLPDIESEYQRLKEFARNDHQKNLQVIAALKERLKQYEEV